MRRNGASVYAATAVASVLVIVVANWLSVAARGTAIPLLGVHLAWALAMTALPVTLVFCLFEKTRPVARRMLIFGLIYVIAFFVVSPVGEMIRTSRFGEIATRGERLVEAVEAYIAENGTPPSRLDTLVPAYLPQIPVTGIAAYPEYVYFYSESRRTWHVGVSVSTGFDWGAVMYYPDQQYPDSWQRFGRWALMLN